MEPWQQRIVQGIGDASGRSGVISEMAGRIYATLFLSPGSLSLDEIGHALAASKGTISVQVRDLLELGMVRKVWVRGSRRDYYEPVTDLWSIATEVIGRRLEHDVKALLSVIEGVEPQMKAQKGASDAVEARVLAMRVFLQMTVSMLEGFRRGEALRTDEMQRAGA